MGEISVKDWSGGLNQRFPGNRIAENECKDATDINISNFRLDSTKGVDTGNTAPGDYKFRGEWVEDIDADKFVEYGTTLLKSYDSGTKLATFTRLKTSGGLAESKNIGVPPKPTSPPNTTTQTGGSSTDNSSYKDALCHHSIPVAFGAPGTAADGFTGDVTNINTSVDAANVFYYKDSSYERVVTFNGTLLKIYDVTSATWANKGIDLVDNGSATSSDVTIGVTPTYKDKWWFQDEGYWVGVSKTGVSVLRFNNADADLILTNQVFTVQTYTGAKASDTAVGTDVFSASDGYIDGWVDDEIGEGWPSESSTVTDYWSATGSNGRVFVSKVKEGYWWTQNGPFYNGGTTVQAKVRNGTSTDSGGWGRTFAVIRKAGSTLTINGYTNGATVSVAGVNYTVEFPKEIDAVTAGGFIFEIFDMHDNISLTTGYDRQREGWFYLSTEVAFKNYHDGSGGSGQTADTNNYLIPGTFLPNGETTFQTDGDYLVVLGFKDNQSTFASTTDKSWTLTSAGSPTVTNRDFNFVSGDTTTVMLRWDDVNKRINYVNRTQAASDNTDIATFDDTYPDPHQYKGQSEYLWGNLPAAARVDGLIHNTGSVYPIKSTELISVALTTPGTVSYDFHNTVQDSSYQKEPNYGSSFTFSNLWNFRQGNRTLSLCNAIEGKAGAHYLSSVVKDTHADPDGSATINLTAEARYTLVNYDNATYTKAFHGNVSTKIDKEPKTSIHADYKEVISLKSFNAYLSKVFFVTGFGNWGEGTYSYKDATPANFTASASWSNVDLAHTHSATKVAGTKLVFYGTNLDVLETSGNTLKTKKAYGVTGNVIKAGYLKDGTDYEWLLFANTRNEVTVVNVLSSAHNEQSVYTLPFDEVIKYDKSTSVEKFYGFSWDAANSRYDDYKKAYMVWFSEFINKLVKDVASGGAGNTGTIKYTFPVIASPTRTRHVLFTTTADEEWYKEDYYIYVGTARIPKISSVKEIVIATGNYTASSDTITLAAKEDMLEIQEEDVVTYTGSNSNVLVTTKTNSSTALVLSGDLLISEGDLTSVDFTFTRNVHKNRVWLHKADYTRVSPDLTQTFLVATYGSTVDGILNFSGHAKVASRHHLPITRSTRDIIFMGEYFYVDLDKHLVQTASTVGATLEGDTQSFNVGNANISFPNGIDYQYRYSFLRDLADSNEQHIDGTAMRFLLEGPPSDESPEIDDDLAGADTNFIRLGFTGSVPDGVTKIRLYRVGGNFARYGYIADLDVTDGSLPSRFDDTTSDVAAFSILPNVDLNPPSEALTEITNVSGIFFAADDSRLYFSRFGMYHSWNEAAFIEMNSKITGIEEYMGEGIVLTEKQVFRVRGFDPFEMTPIVVPDVRGLPENNRKTLIKFGTNLIWLGTDGLCVYAGGNVNIITSGKGEAELFKMTLPHAAIKNNVYYLMQTPVEDIVRNGFAFDFRALPPNITRISQDAESVISVPSEDKVFFKNTINTDNAGAFREGSTQSVSFTSREYDLGALNVDKLFMRARVFYKGSGIINFFSEDETTAFVTKTLVDSTKRRVAYIYPDTVKIGRFFNYTVSGEITIYEMDMRIDMATDYSNQRIFGSAFIAYTGDPTLTISIDGVNVDTTPTLISTTSRIKTVKVSFKGGISGFIPHYKDGSDTGEIMAVGFDTEGA